jgi:TPR repeat protein
MKPRKFLVSVPMVLILASAAAALAQQESDKQPAATSPDACDRLAASPYDMTRPPDVPGVPSGQVDAPLAIEVCKAAVASRPDDARLAFQLARALHLFRDGGEEALIEAARLYRSAADKGHAVARYNLASFYETGRGDLPKDDVEAARLYRLAADQGFALAQSRLGVFYEAGRGGLPKDDQEAVRLYRQAAAANGALQSNNDRASHLHPAVELGLALAQYKWGTLYEAGRGGLTMDDNEAARLYKLAADQGLAVAQYSLGRFYETGRGGLPKDSREASRLYKLAADQGDSLALIRHHHNLRRLSPARSGGHAGKQ